MTAAGLNQEESIHPIVRSGDLARVVAIKNKRTLTDREKVFLLKQSYVPPANYAFPTNIISGKQWRFQRNWLEK